MSGYLPVAKLATQVVAGLGISKIVGDIVRNNVTVVTTVEKVMVHAGSGVLGSMLVQQSTNHIEQVVTDLVAWNEDRKTKNQTEK